MTLSTARLTTPKTPHNATAPIAAHRRLVRQLKTNNANQPAASSKPASLVVSHWNDNPEPFVWTNTADEIIDKDTRGRATLNRIINPATHH